MRVNSSVFAKALSSSQRKTQTTKPNIWEQVIRRAKSFSVSKQKPDLWEQVLIIVFDTFMRTGSGVSTRLLMELTGAEFAQVDKALKSLNTNGVVREETSGWMVA